MESIDKYFLYPSTLFVSEKPHVVTTILGSCVAVCLFDPVLKVGGINHYMLPFWNGQGLASPKYGNIAIQKLIQKMEAKGCRKERLVAKVFGGSGIFQTEIEAFKIGERNSKLALESLQEEGIKVVAKSLGGSRGRKIQFLTSTGQVKMKYIEKTMGNVATK